MMTEFYWQPKWALPYGPMGWAREPGETLFKMGHYTCDAGQEYASSTMTKSCADLLTLLSGRRHHVVNLNLTSLEKGFGKEDSSTHLQNHRVKGPAERLTATEMRELSASFCHNDPPGIFGYLHQRLVAKVAHYLWSLAGPFCGS